LNKDYHEEGNENDQDRDAKEAHNPDDTENNLKQFFGEMENLCEKYERDIGKFQKNIEELKSKNNNSAASGIPRKSSSASDNNEICNNNLYEKCDASTNTDDLSLEDVKEILIKIDNNLTVEHKSIYVHLQIFIF